MNKIKKIKDDLIKLEKEIEKEEGVKRILKGSGLANYLIDCGKNFGITREEAEQLKDTIYHYCDYPNFMVRSSAIRVLCFYWGLNEKKFRDKALELFNNQNEDEETRADALFSWSNTYTNTNSRQEMQFLYDILKNRKYPVLIRSTAYQGFFMVSLIPSKDRPKTDWNWDNFDEEVNWNLVNKLLQEAI